MSAIDELLSEIEEKEVSIRENIRSLELRLGTEAASQHEALGLKVGSKLLEAALSVSAELSEAEAKQASSDEFLSEYRKAEDGLEEVLRALTSLDSEMRCLSIRLGAMIYEQCSFSLLDKETFRVVYDDVEEDRKIEKSTGSTILSRIFGSGKAKVRKMGEEGRFVSYAEIALAAGIPLNGENANAVLEELKGLRKAKEEKEKEKTRIQSYLSGNKEKSRQTERGIELSSSRITALKENEEEALVSYGSYLYDKGSEWIDKDTPSEILDTLEALLHLHNEHDSILSEKDRLDREAKADDYRAMIESEEGKIMVLEKEKERIDREIAEIRNEIDVLRNKIERLKI